jgi:hypothetical protein
MPSQGVFRAAGQLCEVGRCSPVDLGDRVGVVPERGCTAPAVAKTRGGVPQVESAGEELAGGVVPTAFDVQLDPGRSRGVSDLVGGPVGVPWLGVGGVVGEQVRVIGQLGADRCERGFDSLSSAAMSAQVSGSMASQRSWCVLVSLRTRWPPRTT